jgi:hypothetical protein
MFYAVTFFHFNVFWEKQRSASHQFQRPKLSSRVELEITVILREKVRQRPDGRCQIFQWFGGLNFRKNDSVALLHHDAQLYNSQLSYTNILATTIMMRFSLLPRARVFGSSSRKAAIMNSNTTKHHAINTSNEDGSITTDDNSSTSSNTSAGGKSNSTSTFNGPKSPPRKKYPLLSSKATPPFN